LSQTSSTSRIAARRRDTAAFVRAAREAVGKTLEAEGPGRAASATASTPLESGGILSVQVGLDLHDGPLQDLACLLTDLRLLRRQLPTLVGDTETCACLSGAIGDIEARLLALDRDLRDLASSLAAPAVFTGTLEDALRAEIARSGVSAKARVRMRLVGDLEGLSDAHRIALFHVVQETLANVREHSEASELRIAIVAERGAVRARLTDNGRGFDVEETLVEAARNGRLGLVGMVERVRLLGGRVAIESRPGGPTSTLVELPQPWSSRCLR